MIKSMLDTDLYKLTMQYAVLRLYPDAEVEYIFVNRGQTKFPQGFDSALRERVARLSQMSLSNEEKQLLLDKCPFFPRMYGDFLGGYKFNPNEIRIVQDGFDLKIKIVGPWYRTILWEVPLMAMISELYFEMTDRNPIERQLRMAKNVGKAEFFKEYGVNVIEFGTRRRYSYDNQVEVIQDFLDVGGEHFFLGTSNVHLSLRKNIRVFGTMGHEFFSAVSGLKGLRYANKNVLKDWASVYNGELGIALTDTFGTDAFLRDFDGYLARLYDGVRQDSGGPTIWLAKMVNHYRSLGIDPTTKLAIFSDGLNKEEAVKIHGHVQGRMKDAYGIGTYCTNDVGVKPLNIVIKLVKVNGINVVKLSDTPGKATGENNAVNLARATFGE